MAFARVHYHQNCNKMVSQIFATAIVQFMVWAPRAPWAPNTINICWAPKMSWAPIASKKHVGSNVSPAHFGSPADIDGVGSPGRPGSPDHELYYSRGKNLRYHFVTILMVMDPGKSH